MQTQYDNDFYLWASQQVALLKAGRFADLDLVNLIDEVESLGKSERRALESQIRRLLMHLLKLNLQPEYTNTESWIRSIRGARQSIKKLLKENPSLKKETARIMIDEYEGAANDAEVETGYIASPPRHCPYSIEQLLDDGFYP